MCLIALMNIISDISWRHTNDASRMISRHISPQRHDIDSVRLAQCRHVPINSHRQIDALMSALSVLNTAAYRTTLI